MLNLNIDNLIREINPNKTQRKKKGVFVSHCSTIKPYKKYDVKIEKRFFQTCWSHDIPDKWKTSPASIKTLMPDWEYVLMDDNENREFVKKYFPDFLEYYDAFPYNIQRADAIRYLYLYVRGGIYMDLDFELQHPLDSLFTTDADVYLVHSGNVGGYTTNSFMAGKAGAKFWLEMVEYMKKPLPFYYGLSRHFTIMMSAGPIAVSFVASKTSTVIARLPSSLLMVCSVCEIGTAKCRSCTAYLAPLEGGTWMGPDSYMLNFWLCNWKYVVSFLVCFLIVVLIFYILWWLGINNDRYLFKPWKYFHKL